MEVCLYIDNVEYERKQAPPYEFIIEAGALFPNTHRISAIATDDEGAQTEAGIHITVTDAGEECPDFITFDNGKIIKSWKTDSWKIDAATGFDDIYSLKAEEETATVLTVKTLEIYSNYLEFYTKGDNFIFYINGIKVKPLSSTQIGEWTRWVDDVMWGRYTFKWETTSDYPLYLDAVRFGFPSLPQVVTINEVEELTDTSAIVKGDIIDHGNNRIKAKGFCWGKQPDPDITGNRTIDADGMGSYTSRLTGLTSNTTYYVRAYAINSAGTAYGEQISFKTPQK